MEQLVNDLADVLKQIDVGAFGEPQLVKLVAVRLGEKEEFGARVKTMRTPDLLILGKWAVEIKLARPYGENGRAAENWSVNLLHPYEGTQVCWAIA